MKSKGLAFDFEDCSVKLKQNRGDGTPIKNISQPKGNSDTYIYNNSDFENQITSNKTLLTLSNRILELENTLKEKDGIIQNLEIKINNTKKHV